MFADLDTGLGHDDPDRAALQRQGLHHHNLIIARIGGKTKREVDLFNRLGNLGDTANISYLEGSGLREVGIGGPNPLTLTKSFNDLEDKYNRGQ